MTRPPLVNPGPMKPTTMEYAEDIRSRKLDEMHDWYQKAKASVGDDPRQQAAMEQYQATVYRLSQLTDPHFWLNNEDTSAAQIVRAAAR